MVKVIVAIIIGFATSFALCFSIGFLIFSLVLNKSNNFGDRNFLRPFIKEIGFEGQLNLTYKADHIQNDPAVFAQHLEYGMTQLINSPTYQELMKKTIKSPDSEQVATRGR